MQYDWCPYETGNLDTDLHTMRTPHEHESRDRVNVSTSQEMQNIASKPLGARGEACNRLVSHRPQKELTLLTPSPQTSMGWPKSNCIIFVCMWVKFMGNKNFIQ